MRTKILFLSMMLLAGTATGFAESGTCGENLTWTLENDTLTISGTGAMTDYSNTSSVPWRSFHSSITTIVIEEDVTRIGDYSFNNVHSLIKITIPNSVTSISNKN